MTHALINPPPLSRATLAQCSGRVLRHGSRVQPAVVVVRSAEGVAVVKDFACTAWLVRHTYGRWLVSREARIYERLDGVAGVPGFRGRLDALAFAVEFIGGQTLKDVNRQGIPPDAFARLAEVFERIHARGVVHLDSHQKTNILIGPDQRPYLIDFATALYLGTGWLSRRVLVPLFGRPDQWGVLKLRARYRPATLSEGERRRLRRAERIAWLWPWQWVKAAGRWLRKGRRQRDLPPES